MSETQNLMELLEASGFAPKANVDEDYPKLAGEYKVTWQTLPVVASVVAREDLTVARADIYPFLVHAVGVESLTIDALIALRPRQAVCQWLPCLACVGSAVDGELAKAHPEIVLANV